MIKITDKSACCGCSACASICVHKAITMRLSQNKLEMASVVSFQIEVIWISLKR